MKAEWLFICFWLVNAWSSWVNEVTFARKQTRSAHLDKRSTQHHVSSNSRFCLRSPKALYSCFRMQHGHLLSLHDNESLDIQPRLWVCPQAYRRRCVCTWGLIGWANLSVRGGERSSSQLQDSWRRSPNSHKSSEADFMVLHYFGTT